VKSSVKPRKQKLCKMSEEEVEVMKAEVQRLLDAVAHKCGDGPEEEWKMVNVHELHRFE
jgi:hypothetical protein